MTWLWGGFSVDNPTLNRFYSLHYVLPFVIVGVVMLHLLALHPARLEQSARHRQEVAQGLAAPPLLHRGSVRRGVFMLVLALFVFYAPNLLGHPDNYITEPAADAAAHRARMVLPAVLCDPARDHLRSAVHPGQADRRDPDVRLDHRAVLPALARHLAGAQRPFRPVYKWFFWLLVADCVLLGYLGAIRQRARTC